MLCKSCKRKIDEHLCPHCGYNNKSGAETKIKPSETNLQPSESQFSDSQSKSNLNRTNESRMNEDYQQYTSQVVGSGALGNATQNRTIDVPKEEPKQTFRRPTKSNVFGNATHKKTVITKDDNSQYTKTTTTENSRTTVTREKSDSKYNWDSSTHQWNGDVRQSSTTTVDSDFSRILVLSIVWFIMLSSIPVIGLVALIILKTMCKNYLNTHEGSNNYGAVKVINILAIICMIFSIISYIVILCGIIVAISSEFALFL